VLLLLLLLLLLLPPPPPPPPPPLLLLPPLLQLPGPVPIAPPEEPPNGDAAGAAEDAADARTRTPSALAPDARSSSMHAVWPARTAAQSGVHRDSGPCLSVSHTRPRA
jgi:protein TonB